VKISTPVMWALACPCLPVFDVVISRILHGKPLSRTKPPFSSRMSDHEGGSGGGSNASFVVPTQCSALRKGGFVLLKGFPCKILEMTTSKTGKHGHAKAHITGVDIFTEKRYEELCASTHNMDVPNTSRTDFQLVDIDSDGMLTVLDDKGQTRADLKLPELCDSDKELAANIKSSFEGGDEVIITVLNSMGKDAVKAMRINKAQQ